MKTDKISGYMAVRLNLDDRHYWLDTSTFSLLYADCVKKAENTDDNIPHWVKHNPITRIANVIVTEV